MSEQKQEELGIVVRIKAFLKLDEVGKISKFFEKEIKKFTSNIRDLENNAIQMKNIFESALNSVDGIEDFSIISITET